MKTATFPAILLVTLASVGCEKGSADTVDPAEAVESKAEAAAPEPAPVAEDPAAEEEPMDEEPADEDGGDEDEE